METVGYRDLVENGSERLSYQAGVPDFSATNFLPVTTLTVLAVTQPLFRSSLVLSDPTSTASPLCHQPYPIHSLTVLTACRICTGVRE